MKNLETGGHPLLICSFPEFLFLVNRGETSEKLVVQFNTLIAVPEHLNTFLDHEDRSFEQTYQRASVGLLWGDVTEICRSQLLTQANVKRLFKRNIKEMLEYEVVNQLETFGTPTHLVRLDKRTYLLANPSNFTIYSGDGGIGLVCRDRLNTVVCKVERKTEAEHLLNYKEGVKELGLKDIPDEEHLAILRKGF